MTFDEAIVAEMAHSGVLERMRSWAHAHLKPRVEWWTVETQKMCLGMVQMAHAIAERAEQNCPSKGYSPYFETQGFAPSLARGLGSLTLSRGKRQAKEAKRVAPVIEAIRFLARGDGQRRAIVSRAKLVFAAANETSIVDELFSNARLHEGEFLRLLQTIIDGGAIDRQRIKTIAAAIAPSRPRARGPKISAASATHELFLGTNASFGLPAGYTWSDREEDFVDRETQATRQEFGDPDFDPRAAYRRVRERGSVKTGSSRSTIG
jgi:hypothetical protein